MIKALDKRLGVRLNNSNQLVLVYNSTEEVLSETISLNTWNTLVISFTSLMFKVFLPNLSTPITRGSLSINLENARIYIGSDFENGISTKHFDGNLESLMYKTGFITNQSDAKMYFNQKHISSRTEIDELGRITKDELSTGSQVLTTNYVYNKVSDTPGSSKKHLEVTTNKSGFSNTYIFNSIGNLTKKTLGLNNYYYTYDYLNRLIEEKHNTARLIKTFYSGNNISKREVYSNNGVTLDYTLEYTYDITWKERLTKVAKVVGGSEVEALDISYTGSNYIGNPSVYGGQTLTWQGRRLLQIGSNIFYAYNDQGLRVKKVNSTGTTYYHLSGSRIVAESKESYTIFYHYDEQGSIIGFEYNGNQYFYNRDLTGVITDVVDANGNIMVSYEYDAWGKVTNRVINNATVNSKNNFLYKGYYYDEETGWYYLNTRYYDPTTARFINADNVNYLDTDSVENVSLFAYCNNNPVMYTDSFGNSPVPWWSWVISGAQLALGIGLMFVPGAQGLGASLIIGGGIGLISNIFDQRIGQFFGGAGSMANGWGAISTGSGLLSFGPIGWVLGGGLMLIGAGTMIFGANEMVASVTGNNYIQQWTGMNDSAYGWTYLGLNIASAAGTIAGQYYMKYNPPYPGNNPNNVPKGFEDRTNPNANYTNQNTNQSLRPDLNHPKPVGPHWDWRDSNGDWWRLYRFWRFKK